MIEPGDRVKTRDGLVHEVDWVVSPEYYGFMCGGGSPRKEHRVPGATVTCLLCVRRICREE